MLQHYWRITWRILTRNKIYTFINILGLALGICGCLVLFLITRYEFSFDRDHPDQGLIYRVVGEKQSPEETEFLNSPYDDLAAFETQIPGFSATAGVHGCRGRISVPQTGRPPKSFDNSIPGSYMPTAMFTTPGYFDILRYVWLAGSAGSLSRPNNVVLTKSRARLYFGDLPAEEMLGKLIIYDDSLFVHVSGIVKDWEGNTDLGYTDILSVTTATTSFLKKDIPTADWSSLQPHRSMAFVKLSPGVRPEQVNARFAEYIRRHIQLRQAGTSLRMYLQSLKDMHFTHEFHRGDDGDGWRKPYLPTLYVMMGVAVFILLI
ncbi:MAG TPA: ABC transporter permease, partial [Puia sp.]|nr:ABC transporter permease [Puia sp.]